MLRIRPLLLGLLLSLFALAGVALAEEVAGSQQISKILSIDVKGNRNVEKDMVLSKMGTKVGQTLSRKQLSRDVRALHKTGFFSDVRFSGTRTARGIHLVCHLKEYPLIAKLEMEGNEEHGTKDLQLQMKLRPGRIFSPANQESDLNTIRKGYLKDGYYQVNVDFIATPLDDGRVDLLVKVDEGDITTIRRINFIGNEAFSDADLRDQIASRESALVSWFSNKDLFDQQRIGSDAQLVEQHYLNNGYIDVRVETTQLVMTPDKQNFNLAFTLSEGDQYTVSGLELQGDTVPDKETLKELIAMEVDDIYSLADLRATIEALTARVGDEGYAFATVTPLLNRNTEEDTVVVTFDIEKGEEVYVERVEIAGNEKTDDEVVRRLIDQAEGARYKGSQVARSKDSLRRAAYTEDVRVSFPKAGASDKVNMKVDLTEKKTGSFTAGVGYSQIEKLTLTGSVKEENAFGKGYQTSIELSLGKVTKNYNINLTDPYFMNENMSASIGLFKNQTDQLEATNYITDNIGGSIGFGIPLTEHLSYGVNYQYSRNNMKVVDLATITLLLQSQLGKQTTGELAQVLAWDNRDRTVAPTKGHMEQLRVSVAGLGGDNKFYEATFQSKAYFALNDDRDIVFNPSFIVGRISGYGQKQVPLYRRYSLGGIGTVRGFDALGISLRDPITNEAVGGDKRLNGSLNLFFPLPYMQTAGIRGLTFVDAGTVWGKAVVVNVSEKFSAAAIRVSAGVGFEWLSPVGPIGISWALPIRKKAGDVERSFEFALGGSF